MQSCFLVCALPYDNGNKKITIGQRPKHYAVIAPFARFNYYKEAVIRLKRIALFLRTNYGGTKGDYRIFCNSRIPEKKLAAAAGIGSLGKNNLIITKEAGSRVILAAMLIPPHLENLLNSEPNESNEPKEGFSVCECCKDKPACVASCPTGAITAEGKINLADCIQWYASGNGETVPAHIASKWGNVFYGCTKCQDVCPHNKRKIAGAKTNLGRLDAYIDTENFLKLSDDEIKKKFKGTALGMSWLTPNVLRRNIHYCCGVLNIIGAS
jgi:epoxyqueuosine reductase